MRNALQLGIAISPTSLVPGAGGGVVYPSVRNFVSEGDSLTATSTNSGGSYSDRSEAVAAPAMDTYTNAAVSGAVLHDTIGSNGLVNRATTVDGYLVEDAANILSVMIGYNDLIGATVSTWLAELASYLDDRRAAGWFVILCTVLPRTETTFNTKRNTVNAEIRLWTSNGSTVPGKHADAICDFAADPLMGNDGDATNGTYRTGDGIHLQTAGTVRLFHILSPVLDAAMRNDTSNPVITYDAYECETASVDTRVYLEADRGVVWSISGDPEFTLDELWRLNLDNSVAGEFTTTLTATDGGGRHTSVTFTWTVVDPPSGYGPNLVRNGKFLNGVYGWTSEVTGGGLFGVDENGVGFIDAFALGLGFPQVYQSITTVVSTNYRATADMAKNTANASAVLKVKGTNIYSTAASLTPMTPYDFAASATATDVRPFIFSGTATGRMLFDNIAVREVL